MRLSSLAVALALALPLAAQAAPITLTGTIRDFNFAGTVSSGVGGHPDFEAFLGSATGIVESTLGGDGKPVLSAVHPTVTSAASFHQWYHDDPTVNATGSITITLDPITATTYQYSNNNFFPIDGLLLAQNIGGHNFAFTTEFHTQFTYQTANDDNFSFSGDDDVWVFINGVLAIDLGGVHGAIGGSVNLNTFAALNGLVNGSDYTLDVFQAERHTTGSNFTMTTSLQLVTPPTGELPEPASLGLVGAALLAAGAAARRRR
ncbi:fibro-slime domain-containing protein [Roseateles sp.]|uniref:fibro-slime domain-containing protein n=1 Tax=Roseateles sp. TaxID=1971397 RepID=UPI003267DFFD